MINTVFEISLTLFDSAACIWCIALFNKDSKRKVYFWLPAFLVISGTQLIFDWYAVNFDLLNTSISFAISLIYALIISNKHIIKAIVSACIFKAFFIGLSQGLFNLYSVLFKDFTLLLQGAASVPRYIYCLTHKVLLFAALMLILRLFDREGGWRRVEGVLSFVFSILTVLGMWQVMKQQERTDTAEIRYIMLNVTVVLILLNVIFYVVMSRLSKTYKKTYELELKAQVAAFEAKRYENALTEWNRAEKIRHDVKNQMIALSGMLEDGDTDGCRRFLKQYLSDMESPGKFSRSGNNIIDCLIEQKLSSLTDTQIVVSGFIDDLSDIKETDLASLIGNILDNAVEAEEKVADKRIELRFFNQNENRIILCKNNIESSVLEKNRELKTSKKSKAGHGFGHQIIRDITEKYHGFSDFYEENGMFCVQVVLPK